MTISEGGVSVIYCKTHVGHNGEIGRMRIPHNSRYKIAEKIALKVPVPDILDEFRSSVSSNLQRTDLVTEKDVSNIVRDYNLKSNVIRHRNDTVSVES